MECEVKSIINDHKGHYILAKGIISEEDCMIMNTYTSNKMALKYLKQHLWRKSDKSKN